MSGDCASQSIIDIHGLETIVWPLWAHSRVDNSNKKTIYKIPKIHSCFISTFDFFLPLNSKNDGKVDVRENTQKWRCLSVSTASSHVHLAYCIWDVLHPPKMVQTLNDCETVH